VLYVLLRLVRSPFGHALVGDPREPAARRLLGYPVERYKLAVFVISAVVTGLGAGWSHSRIIWCPQKQFRCVRRRIAGDGRDRRHAQHADRRSRAVLILFRELFSIWTPNWLALVRADLRRLCDVLA